MIRKLLLVSFVFMSSYLYSQNILGASAGVVSGFNSDDVYLWEYKVEEKPSIGFYAMFNYRYQFKFPVYVRTGIGFQQFYSEIVIKDSKITGYSNNFLLPIAVGYNINDKWNIDAGVSFQDFREREDFAAMKSNNIRTNITFNVSYEFLPNFEANFGYSQIVSDKINSFMVVHRSYHFMLGVTYNMVVKRKNKQNTENDETNI